jgi:hypothetical protein
LWRTPPLSSRERRKLRLHFLVQLASSYGTWDEGSKCLTTNFILQKKLSTSTEMTHWKYSRTDVSTVLRGSRSFCYHN